MASIRTNVIYKALLIFSNYIFGFVTFPYVTRILGPSEFGLVNFALGITDYFLLFATMGIATIGTREIAACRNDQSMLCNQFSKILGTNLLFTLFSSIAYLICLLAIPRLNQHFNLFLVGLAKILFSAFMIEWLFTGIENFKFITIRSFIIKGIYVASVFIFVKKPEDYFLYFVLTILTVVINAFVNSLYAHRFVRIVWKKLTDMSLMKQNLQLGFYMIMTSMYITFNVIYLGFVSNDAEVGFYSAAVKLYFIAVNLFSAFTSVMIPRMSALKSDDNWEQGKRYIEQSYSIALSYSIPIVILGMLFAPEIIEIVSGAGYHNAILPMRILIVALLFVCVAQVIVFQGIIPLKKDNYLTIASLIGGSLALLLNIFLTPHLHSVGSAIVLVGSESVITVYYIVIVKRQNLFPLLSIKNIISNIVKSIPYIFIGILSLWVFNGIFSFIVAAVLSAGYFFILYKSKRLVFEI